MAGSRYSGARWSQDTLKVCSSGTPQRVAVVSLLGDELQVVTGSRKTGSHLDSNRRDAWPIGLLALFAALRFSDLDLALRADAQGFFQGAQVSLKPYADAGKLLLSVAPDMGDSAAGAVQDDVVALVGLEGEVGSLIETHGGSAGLTV